MECGSHRAIKLLEYAMKVIERVFERTIREKVKIDAMQFGLMPAKGTTDAIFNSHQSGRFWAMSTASVHDSPWESRSFCIVFIQVIRSRPGGLFQYTEVEEVKICFASILSSIRAIYPNRVRRHAWIISISRGFVYWTRQKELIRILNVTTLKVVKEVVCCLGMKQGL